MKISSFAFLPAGIGSFLAVLTADAAVLYSVQDLGTVGGAFRSEAHGINQKGLVWLVNWNADLPYFTWQDGTVRVIAKPKESGANITLYGMNDAGQFAGVFSYPIPSRNRVFLGSPAHPILLNVTNFSPRGLNLRGDIVGVTGVRVETYPGSGVLVLVNRPAVLRGRQMTVLPSLAGDNVWLNAEPTAINDDGVVVGWSGTSSNVAHAFLWDGAMRDLHTLGARSNSIATAVNNNGMAAGYMYDYSNFREPFAWTPGGNMTALNLPPGYNTGQPLGMNNRGDIVGVAGSGSAVLWTNGVMTDLQTVIPSNPAWDLEGAYAINDSRQIVGYGKSHGFLLQPTNVPPTQFAIKLLNPVDPSAGNALTGVSVTTEYSILNSLSARGAGVAADGASKLVVRVSATNHGTVTLSLRAAEGASGVTGKASEDGSIGGVGGVAGLDSYSLATTSTAQGERAYALYHAPEIFHRAGFVDSDLPQRVLALRAVFVPDTGHAATQTVSLLIVRPPLIVMHGLWSNRRAAFGGFEDAFNLNEPGVQIFGPAQYPNDAYFSSNEKVLPDAIAAARGAFREQDLAAARADVFSHSMGGILSRIYAGSPNYKRSDNYHLGDINRLVTIDSPHRGSFLADLQEGLFPWLSLSSWGRKQRDAIEFLMRDMGKSVTAGASYDLSSTSGEIVKMNQRPTDVAAHVIAGDFELVADYTQYPPPFGAIYKLFYQVPGFDYTPVRFQVPFDSDLVVSLDSQGAGLPTPPPDTAPSTVFAHLHEGAANTANVTVRSLFLYRQRPRSSWFWKGFPIGWSPPFQAELPPPPSSGPTATNHYILLLASGPDVNSGQQMQCSAAPPEGVTFTSVAFLTPDAYSEDTNAPFSATLTVGPAAVGSYQVSYLARDTASNTWWGTQTLSVTPLASLNYLEIEPRRFTFNRLGQQEQIAVSGVYFDRPRDVTDPSTGTTYASADTNVVSVTTDGVMTARCGGATHISVSNGAKTAFVEVVVELLAAPDLALSQTVSASSVMAGAPVTFTLRVTNTGPETAMAAYLSDLLPADAQFLSATVRQGIWSSTNGLFAVELGALAPTATATATVTLAFSNSGTQLNTAIVSCLGLDANDSDNLATASVSVIPPLGLNILSDGAEVVLTWPTNANGYLLENTTNLAASSPWELLSSNAPAIGNQHRFTVPPTNTSQYFRLRKP